MRELLVGVVLLAMVAGIGVFGWVLLREPPPAAKVARVPAPPAKPTVPPKPPPPPPPRWSIDGPLTSVEGPRTSKIGNMVRVDFDLARPGSSYYLGLADLQVEEAVTDSGERLLAAPRSEMFSWEAPTKLHGGFTLATPTSHATRLVRIAGTLALVPDGPLRAVRVHVAPTAVWTAVRGIDRASLAAISDEQGVRLVLSDRLAGLFAGASFHCRGYLDRYFTSLHPASDGFAVLDERVAQNDLEAIPDEVELRFFDPARLERHRFEFTDLPMPPFLIGGSATAPKAAVAPPAEASAVSYRCSSIDLVD
jgi:hypothetical protein